MYSSLPESKGLVFVPILTVMVTQLLLMGSVSSLNMTNAYVNHKCLVNQGKYKPGSRHEEYLNKIVQTLSKTKLFRTGYSMMSLGDEPDMVVVTFQCRADSYGSKCRSCFATAQSELRKRCRGYKGGLIWYDQCLVEISSIKTDGQINYDDGLCMPSVKNVSDDDSVSFGETLILFDNLTDIAVTKKNKNLKDIDKPALYAAGEKKLGKKMVYGMVQCTDDLSVKGCRECMTYNIVHFQKCYKDKEGARVLGKSCNFRYEIYPFINAKTSPNYIKF